MSDTLRILTVSHAYAVPENRIVWERMVELFDDVHVIIVTPKHFKQDDFGAGEAWEVVPEKRERFQVLPLPLTEGRFRGLGSVLRGFQPHLFFLAGIWSSWSTILPFLQCKLFSPGTKRVGVSLQNIEYQLKWPHHVVREKLALKVCDAILAGDRVATTVLKDHGYRGRIENLYFLGAVQDSVVSSHIEKTADKFAIGYVGRLFYCKGVSDLLQAVSQLDGNWKLELVGDGVERQKLEQMVLDLGISQRVIFHGQVERTQVLELMQRFDILVLPSRSDPRWKEQFGVVLVEAMRSSVPIVGSDCGAIPEVVGNAGIIFPEGDAAALKEAIQHLMADKFLRLELGRHGHARFVEMYSASAFAKRLYEFSGTMLSDQDKQV